MSKVKQYYEEILYMKRMQDEKDMLQFARAEADYMLQLEAYAFEDNCRSFEPTKLTDVR